MAGTIRLNFLVVGTHLLTQLLRNHPSASWRVTGNGPLCPLLRNTPANFNLPVGACRLSEWRPGQGATPLSRDPACLREQTPQCPCTHQGRAHSRCAAQLLSVRIERGIQKMARRGRGVTDVLSQQLCFLHFFLRAWRWCWLPAPRQRPHPEEELREERRHGERYPQRHRSGCKNSWGTCPGTPGQGRCI